MKLDMQIEKEAALWLVRRDRGEPGPGGTFEAWLAADSRHRTAYLALEGLWRDSDQLKVYRPRNGTLDPLILKTTARRPRRWMPAVAAAAILVLCVMGWALRQPAAVYTTDVGGFERALLPDGSMLLVNTNSKVEVQRTAQVRAVTLVRGEAHFVVAYDKQRPFEVTAGNTLVRAIGTAFTVRMRDPNNVKVLVTEGRVQLRQVGKSNSPQVGAAEVAEIKAGSATVLPVPAAEVGRMQAWQSGTLIFEDMPLGAAVAEFNRYNRRQLVLENARLAQLELGGEFRATDVDGFLRALKSSFGIQARETNGVIRLQ